jgi:glycosyltransferase involved in cell wall biosynthesis
MMSKRRNPCILYVSTFPPRECGIATFTQDLTNAIDKEFSPEIKSKILALNDSAASIYNYQRKVVLQLSESDIEDYLNLANEINHSPHIKLVSIQHEYGIFGGDWGNYLLPFLELVKKPIIITMHTILPRPPEIVKKITKSIAERTAGIVVMTKTAAHLLENVYGVKKNKINVIPHGVHHIPFPSKNKAKLKLNLSGHTIISTFGMLNRDKGIEYAIEALPEVIKQYPNLLYLVLGATHPNIIKQEGERYRNKLMRLVIKHNLQDNVKFYNRYLELEELIDFLKATDIYLSPTLNPRQSVSGTISYALSCACPIIATENQYAKDVVNHERGILVKFKNSEEIKNALLSILADKKARKEMGKNSYFYSRHMTWQNVALSYFKIFNNFAKIVPQTKGKLPPFKLDYIDVLTNKFGIIQFANHTKPDPHSGFCLDDNARALLGYAEYYDLNNSPQILKKIELYLKFVKFTQKPSGKFYNFVTYQHTIHDESESEDSFGRAIWALGFIISDAKLPENFRKMANGIFKKTTDWLSGLRSFRAIAFSILGLCYIAEKDPDNKEILSLIKKLSDKLIKKFEKQMEEIANEPENNSNSDGEKIDWVWFENFLTYSNSKLPESLFKAYKVTGNRIYLEVAEKTLGFLNSITFDKEFFAPIGQDGWYFRNGKRAFFDQQPEDTSSAVEALVTAYEVTNKKVYKDQANLAFGWFLGNNHLNQMLYDEATGGCYDGLGRFSINFNQGAESTLSYFLARLAIEKIQ